MFQTHVSGRLIRSLLSIVLVLAVLLNTVPLAVKSATLVVTSKADSGNGTLRQKMGAALSGDIITFDPAVFPPGNPATINVQSPLPALSRNGITIDASNAGVILDGAQAPVGTNGLVIQANSCVIRGLRIQHFSGNGISVSPGASGNTLGGDHSAGTGPSGQGNIVVANYATGIEFHNAVGNVVRGNYVGINPSDQSALGNALSGVAFWDGSRNNIIGGTTDGDRNVLSGNGQNGVWIGGPGSDQNIVIGNYIGTRTDGMGAVPNRQSGVSIPAGAQNNRIGGTGVGEGNLISGNADYGVYIADAGTRGNQVLGNLIGPNKLGTAIIGHGFDGVIVTSGANQNIIGSAAGRNVISGSAHDGIHITGSSTTSNTVQGNYIGTNPGGTAAWPNGMHGVEVSDGANHNLIGGNRLLGQGNLLSGNQNHGLVITVGAHHNTVSGNIMGPDATGTYSLGYQPYGAMDMADGAHDNVIGGLAPGAGNLISGNGMDGIALFDNTTNGTNDNQILGNLIGLTLDGSRALPNHGPGIFSVLGAARTRIEGNTVSGNLGNGVQLSGGTSFSDTVIANQIGTDLTGTIPIANGGYGLWVSEGSHGNLIENNTMSGNALGGVLLKNNGGAAPYGNTLRNNRIGIDLSGLELGNGGTGISILETANNNVVGPGNIIAFNVGSGIKVESCSGNTLSQNSIYSNTLTGLVNSCVPAPQITGVALGANETVIGTAVTGTRVELFVDDNEEGRQYVGYTTADNSGIFTFTQPSGFPGPNVTATSTDVNNNTSAFSRPAHLSWTVLLYLNGDNDLENDLRNTLNSFVAAGPSPRANVLVLIDGYTSTEYYTGTVLYDITYSQAISIATQLGPTLTVPGELNMGDGQTLAQFVNWGRDHYPARYTMLSIVDHGGGWAPSSDLIPEGGLPIPVHAWLGGGSGVSWDFSSGYDYLNSRELRQTLATITNDGARPLDVVFYDVCLMGMLEVAYQIKDYASVFVSSQNIGWSPVGPQGRYVQMIQGITPNMTPAQFGSLIVSAYASTLPPTEHPFTISALDLTRLPAVTNAINQLGIGISQTLTSPAQADVLHQAYSDAQKLDYDSDFSIEPATDGFVDLYDFALHASQQFTDTSIIIAARAVTEALTTAVIAEAHRSGSPWLALDQVWNLDNVHGLSIFLPLGEDLQLPIVITETSQITPGLEVTRNLHLRELYSSSELQFVGDINWGGLINTYYQVVSVTAVTRDDGPLGGLREPDVTAPRTIITVTGAPSLGRAITLTWEAVDIQPGSDRAGSGVRDATLWYRPPFGHWTPVLTQTGSSGVFSFMLSTPCLTGLAVLATDRAGNVESVTPGENAISVDVPYCRYLPLAFR
jgi:parallel beta-helix repeat protein